MATFEDLRAVALGLPLAEEISYRGEPWFNVGRKTFALRWKDRTVLKLDKNHQVFLFEVRPDTFQPCPVATSVWSYVALENLDADELRDLVVEAWTTIVPKKVSRPYLAAPRLAGLTAPA